MGAVYMFWKISELIAEHAESVCPHWRDGVIARLLFIFDAVPTIFMLVLLVAAIITTDVYVWWINVALYVGWIVVWGVNWGVGVVGPQGSECIYAPDQFLDDGLIQMLIIAVMYLMIGIHNRTWIIPWYYTLSLQFGLWCIYLNHLYRRVNTVQSVVLSTWVGLLLGLVFYAMMPIAFPYMRRCIDYSPLLSWMQMRNRYFRNLGDPLHVGRNIMLRDRGLADHFENHHERLSKGEPLSETLGGQQPQRPDDFSRLIMVPDEGFLENEKTVLTCMRITMATWMTQFKHHALQMGYKTTALQATDIIQSIGLGETEEIYVNVASKILSDTEVLGRDTYLSTSHLSPPPRIEQETTNTMMDIYRRIRKIARPNDDVVI